MRHEREEEFKGTVHAAQKYVAEGNPGAAAGRIDNLANIINFMFDEYDKATSEASGNDKQDAPATTEESSGEAEAAPPPAEGAGEGSGDKADAAASEASAPAGG